MGDRFILKRGEITCSCVGIQSDNIDGEMVFDNF